MEKRNIRFSLFVMLFLALLSFGITSCSDDDDRDNGISLAGTTWVCRDYSEMVVFTSSNSGRWYYDLNYSSEYDTFTYSYSSKNGGVAKVKEIDDDGDVEYYTVTFKIEDDVLYLYDEDGDYYDRFYKYEEDD